MIGNESLCTRRTYHLPFSYVPHLSLPLPPSRVFISLTCTHLRSLSLSLSLSLFLSLVLSRSFARSISHSLTHSLTHSLALSLALSLLLFLSFSLSLSLSLSPSPFLLPPRLLSTVSFESLTSPLSFSLCPRCYKDVSFWHTAVSVFVCVRETEMEREGCEYSTRTWRDAE